MNFSKLRFAALALCCLAAFPVFATPIRPYLRPSGNGGSPCAGVAINLPCSESDTSNLFVPLISGSTSTPLPVTYLVLGNPANSPVGLPGYNFTYYDTFNLGNVLPGMTFTFNFSAAGFANAMNNGFGTLGCSDRDGITSLDNNGVPAVTDSQNNGLGVPCTNASLGVPNASAYFSETLGTNSISYAFHCLDGTVTCALPSDCLTPNANSPVDPNSAFPCAYLDDNQHIMDWGFFALDNVSGGGANLPTSIVESDAVQAVPEPATLPMLSLGLVALAALSLKKFSA